jgi:succinate dehydrogenase / fumarate reductase iron-sulfur subunit
MTAPDFKRPEKVVVKVKRQEGPGAAAYWETFELPYKPNLNLTAVLRAIGADPVTCEGKKTTPPTYDAACLEEVCGSCTMVINGKARQACSALVDQILAEKPGPITIEPMSKFPLIRDLQVDRTRMFENLKRVRAWVPIDSTYKLGPGPRMDPQTQDEAYALSRCMTCGCCLEACPQFTLENHFVGAQILSQVKYFNLHPTGKVDADARMDAVMGQGGITDCGNAQNCVQVCPKEIPLVDSIGWVGRKATVYSIKKFFSK